MSLTKRFDATTPYVASKNFVKQAPNHDTNPILLIRTHPYDRYVAHIRNTALINVAQTIDDDHRHVAPLGVNYLSTAPFT